ncbi:MAG: hypothetical protein G9473_05760 [Erythrobacter sp.]|nr:MAG: hypothetical protein G9473_05760 [Erythrobacter sp.]
MEQAIARIEAALTRLESARPPGRSGEPEMENSPRVLALVDRHEKLREEVAETLRDLDALIAEIEP